MVILKLLMDTFKHSKSLGQNFLTDKNLLAAIVADAGIERDDTVIEVGAGQGALTEPLAKTGARVISYEIDSRLLPALGILEERYPNLTIINADIMKIADGEIAPGCRFKVVANLPYYITTPVLFKFIEAGRADSITVMVQQEVAERIVAPPGGKDYGVLSVTAQLAGKPRITRKVGRNMFTPPPNVDSAVVRLDMAGRETPVGISSPDINIRETNGADETADGYEILPLSPSQNSYKKTRDLVRAAFSMRRKTLVNCLCASGYNKEKVLAALSRLGFPSDVRGERLSPSDFAVLGLLV